MRLQPLYQRLQTWIELRQLAARVPSVPVIVGTSLLATGLVMVLELFGKVQQFELTAYDRIMQIRPEALPDQRLLIVGITEADIEEQWRLTPSDEVLAQVLAKLEQYQPRVIGLDLHRNIPQPPGWNDLLQQLESDRVVVIKKLGDTADETIDPPPGVPPDRVGFNDLPIDTDGVVRRNLIIGSNEQGIFYSFGLQLALKYLAAEGVTPQASAIDPNFMRLGQATLVPLEPSSGGYQGLDAGGYQILLDYRSSHFGARQVSLTDVVRGDIEPEWVEDKIVLIGTTATSLKDLFFTPYSSSVQMSRVQSPIEYQLPGVAIHAQMTSQILAAALGERPLFWFLPRWGELLWMWSWAAVSGAIAWFIRRSWLLGSTTVGLAGLLGSSSYFTFVVYAGWLPIVAPALTSLLTLGIVVTYRAQQAQQQQHMVMTLLGQSTSPEIADALWKSRDRLLKSGKLPGQMATATMLFSDIKEFSTLAEHLPPEELMNWLNEYLDEMTAAVKVHRGIVNKFTGDGLLAVFGVPVPRTTDLEIATDAKQAVRCALAMRDALKQLNQQWQAQGKAAAQMRVGIFTGPVVVGSLGGKERMEYGVIGDSVNTAARLEGCVKEQQVDDCRILIAYETLQYLSEEFEVEPWGLIPLKGKQHMADVYRVIGRANPLAASLPLEEFNANLDTDKDSKKHQRYHGTTLLGGEST